jgi:CBS domain-containing protein
MAFEAFCSDISVMFGLETQCSPLQVTAESVKDLSKYFKELAAVSSVETKGTLDGTFQLVFDKVGLFTLAGITFPLTQEQILKNTKAGSTEDAEALSNALSEAANVLIEASDKLFRERLPDHDSFVLSRTFIGDPWDEPQEKMGLAPEEEFLAVLCEMTVGPYPTFNCAAIFPKTIFAGPPEQQQTEPQQKTDSEAEDKTDEATQIESEDKAQDQTDAEADQKVEPQGQENPPTPAEEKDTADAQQQVENKAEEAKPQVEEKTQPQAKEETEPQAQDETEENPEPQTEEKAEPQAEEEAQPKAEEKTEPQAQDETEENSEPQTQGKPDPQAEEQAQTKAEEQTKPAAEEQSYDTDTDSSDESAEEKAPTDPSEEQPVSETIQKMTSSPAVLPGETNQPAAAENVPACSDTVPLMTCAEDVMQKDIGWIAPENSVQDALTILQQNDVDYIMVGSDKNLEGIVSRSDVNGALSPYLQPMFAKWRRPLDDATLRIKIKWIMTRTIRTVNQDTPLTAIMQTMCQFDWRALPVIDKQGNVQGLVTAFDIFRALLKADHNTSAVGKPIQAPLLA